jgi:7,8-dihydropterin-6-yl-methyl-4-(beta-D-ribofuranosyl)aminobenzene 5'-phosphate synthase
MKENPSVSLTILYDNNPPAQEAASTNPTLRLGWGFSCLVERGETTLLFDTGGDAPTLHNNLRVLGVNPADIDYLVLSHYHADHTGGLDAILDAGAKPTIFLLATFPADFKTQLASRTAIVEVTGPLEIAEGIRTTGEMGTAIAEQSLIVEAGPGLIVLTGCAHPGIIEIARTASAQGEVELAIGGFHLRSMDAEECAEIAAEMHAVGVRHVAATHCTGDTARHEFAAVFGDGFVSVGIGSQVQVAG